MMKGITIFLSFFTLSCAGAATTVIPEPIPDGPVVIPEPRENDTIIVVPEPRQDGPIVIPEPRATRWQNLDFQAADEKVTYANSGYPRSYSENEDSGLMIYSPQGTKIQVQCDDFNVEMYGGCQKDQFMASPTGRKDMADARRTCGSGRYYVESKGDSMAIRFVTGRRVSSGNYRFKCTITCISTTVATTTTAKTTTRPASGPSTNSNCVCGARNDEPRIVGGEEAGSGPIEFPWRCVLYSPYLGHFCGSTIISENWIMTAAHCTAAVPKGTQISAKCGTNSLKTLGVCGVEVPIDYFVDHPNYNNKTQDNDISLLHLSKKLTFNKCVSPDCLPWEGQGNNCETPGTSITASGWGALRSSGSQPTTLQKVDLPCISTNECKRYYGGSITDNMICTYSPGTDTCQDSEENFDKITGKITEIQTFQMTFVGDSGGSIDYKDKFDGRHYAIGVVSWGVGCAEVGNPGAYAKTTKYLDWIEANTADATFCKS